MHRFIRRINIPYEVKFVVIVFLISRILLTFFGVWSRSVFSEVYDNWYKWRDSNIAVLDIWSVWDSTWYLDIAKNGYSIESKHNIFYQASPGQSNIGFFPLYPLLMGSIGKVIGNYHTAGVLISNITLIFAGILLYKLVLLDKPKDVARKCVLYMFLFPTSFILSGVFTESLFLLLLILCFYTARKQKWLLSGLCGFLLSLTRANGFLCAIPILYLYLKSNRYKPKKNVLFLFLYPLGSVAFCTYLYFLTGDFFAYYHSKTAYWWTIPSNPFHTLWGLLTSNSLSTILFFFIISLIIVVALTIKKIRFEYSILSLLFVFTSLSNGTLMASSIPRMSCAFFPFFLSLVAITENQPWKTVVPTILVPLQIIFMMLWSVGVLIV